MPIKQLSTYWNQLISPKIFSHSDLRCLFRKSKRPWISWTNAAFHISVEINLIQCTEINFKIGVLNFNLAACGTSVYAFDFHQCPLHLQQSWFGFHLIRHIFPNYILKKDYGDEEWIYNKYETWERNPVTVLTVTNKLKYYYL